ncbi:acyl carrier protein [Streptomyces sp. NPDC001595]|uniref:acyl carrier protein n=1 Tax=Streptomyces sp. NPDC001532 TaxID=3154520 RepID=UPI00331C24E0
MSIAPDTTRTPLDRRPAAGLAAWLTERVAFHLHQAPEEIDPDIPLADYGIDSVAAISICGEIEERHRIAVAPTVAYDFPTVRALTEHLAELLARAGRS